MWIESDTYIGPCRRGGAVRTGFRLFNRRRRAAGDRDPSLQALLRQLRANALDLSGDLQRRRFKLRLTATIGVARRAQQNAAAQVLERLDRAMTESALAEARSVTVIEQLIEQAAATLPQR